MSDILDIVISITSDYTIICIGRSSSTVSSTVIGIGATTLSATTTTDTTTTLTTATTSTITIGSGGGDGLGSNGDEV